MRLNLQIKKEVASHAIKRNQNRAQSEKTQSVQETGLFTEIATQWRDNLMVMMKSLQLEL